MKQIITDLSLLGTPAEPLKYLNDKGEIFKEEGEKIIKELKDLLEANPKLVAVSAPQIGINKRIFCIKFSDCIKTFINPIINKKKDGLVLPETFASMPGKEILIGRPSEITAVYCNDKFEYEDNKFIGAAARLFDQQALLLDGVLPSDLGLVSDIEQDGSLADLSEEELKEVQKIYEKYINLKKEGLKKAIEKDEELSNQYKRLNFAEKVINGQIAVVQSEEEEAKSKKAVNLANSSIAWSSKLDKDLKNSQNKAHLETFLKHKKHK